ncbi:glyoxylate/hydroxypyruvate reductase A [Phenylobacterium sp.]|uniref:2-hydroxyacid dehydrogenase n=1 Tax=Phenylobacterium sp. TaxID=1871053 RepID=UPI002CCA5FF8|nr:glyoxylate/hydroxypyruvate reductase A [Phenylobacterium sp.]HVI33711.1 glyoxylate/hydroxypyruvate reductase A [Phenylobacterium sp.]
MNAQGRPVLLFAYFRPDAEAWLEALQPAAELVEIRRWPEAGDPGEVDYIVAWQHPPGFLGRFPAVKAIFWIGAGVDRLLLDPELPEAPVVRMLDESLSVGMAEYVAERVLHYHRLMPIYGDQQQRREWRPLQPPLARDRKVAVLGLGEIGGACAAALASLGFDVRGWSRSLRSLPGVQTANGPLAETLAGCEIVVCVLPLTPQTRGILNAETFAALTGAYLINVGRGGHLVEADLIPALDAGRLAGATLDVFETEPLPAEHPFWGDPRIVVTPHAAAVTHPSSAGAGIVANLRRAVAGEPLVGVVDRTRGY